MNIFKNKQLIDEIKIHVYIYSNNKIIKKKIQFQHTGLKTVHHHCLKD